MNGATAVAVVVIAGGGAALLASDREPLVACAAVAMTAFSLLVLLEWHVRPTTTFSLIAPAPLLLGASSFLLAAFGLAKAGGAASPVLLLGALASFTALVVLLGRATSAWLALLCLPLLLLYTLLCAIGGVLGFALTALHTPPRPAAP